MLEFWECSPAALIINSPWTAGASTSVWNDSKVDEILPLEDTSFLAIEPLVSPEENVTNSCPPEYPDAGSAATEVKGIYASILLNLIFRKGVFGRRGKSGGTLEIYGKLAIGKYGRRRTDHRREQNEAWKISVALVSFPELFLACFKFTGPWSPDYRELLLEKISHWFIYFQWFRLLISQ